jgi:SecD/SecF fusion protein
MQNRSRNVFVLAIVAGLLLVSLYVIATQPTSLGLDLKGGVQLTYEGKPTAKAKLNNESMERAIEIMRKRIDQLGLANPEIQRSGAKEIQVSLPNVHNVQRAIEEVGKTAQLYFYDWEPNVIGPNGQPAPTDSSVTGGIEPGSTRSGATQHQAVLRAEKRPPILPPKDSDLVTYQPGCTLAKNEATSGPEAGCIYGQWYLLDESNQTVLRGPEDTKAELFAPGVKIPPGAKTRAVHLNPGTVVVQALPEQALSSEKAPHYINSWYVLNDNPQLTGNDMTNPRQEFENGGQGAPDVAFDFTGHGRKVFEEVTRAIAKRGENAALPGVPKQDTLQHFAIVLDNQLITAPSIDYRTYPEGIDATNGSEITGGFTVSSAQNLANELASGALPIGLNLISESQVSATLGSQALRQGVTAGLAGLLVVCLFLLIFYRVLGVLAIGGLAIYGIYLFALIKAIPVTLTLPGIAGVILTIGVAADTNIVIFERIKEEIRGGRSVAAGIASGYRHGFAAIIDANVVTFMTAFILFALATAEVKGFAFMLGLGVIVQLFTAVLATQAALGTMARTNLIAHPLALGAGKKRREWRMDFMGSSRWFFTLSGTILLIGALAIGGKGLNFGIDFKSGTRIQTSFDRAVTQNEIRSVMRADGFGDAQIQKFTSKGVGGTGYQISVKRLTPEKLQTVRSQLETKLGAKRENFSANSIGPTFGSTVANEAVIAIIASLLVISVYIAWRFEWKYAMPVLIALMHDLLITTGVYALTGREVTAATVAALLTILGYSMYDTIIVFDRVRENVPRMPRAAFSQIVNRSMSEVLTRSLATSFCTLLPVLALLLFGGETLQDFAFALLVGIASGAYSSIFIASPVLTHWKERESSYRNRRARLEREYGMVPAYAVAAGGPPIDSEQPVRRNRRGRPVAPEEPGEQISKEEFDDLVADLDVEQTEGAPVADEGAGARAALATRTRGRSGVGRRGRSDGAQEAASAQPEQPATPAEPAAAAPEDSAETAGQEAPEQASPADPTADATPEELVLKEKPAPKGARRQRSRRHGRRR